MGAYLKEKLFALKEKYPCISDVRGIGLMVAIEFSHKDGSPAPDIWAKVKNSVSYRRQEAEVFRADSTISTRSVSFGSVT